MQKEPAEGLFRAMLIVIMDNSSAEYSFIRQFFNRDEPPSTGSPAADQSTGDLDVEESVPGSPVEIKRRQSDTAGIRAVQQTAAKRKADDAYFDGIWKQVMEPVLQYADVSFFNARLLWLICSPVFYQIHHQSLSYGSEALGRSHTHHDPFE
jgi:vacuolar protein sorting-associated protein 52